MGIEDLGEAIGRGTVAIGVATAEDGAISEEITAGVELERGGGAVSGKALVGRGMGDLAKVLCFLKVGFLLVLRSLGRIEGLGLGLEEQREKG